MKRIFYLLAIFLLLGCNKTDEKQVGANSSENKISTAGNISTQQLEK